MPWYFWLLLTVQLFTVIWVYALSRASKKKEPDTAEGREEKIFQLYGQIEEMLDSFEEYVGEVHSQLEDKRTELIELNRQAQVVYMQTLDTAKPAAAPVVPENILAPPPKASAAHSKRDEKHKKEPKKVSRLSDNDKEALGRFATKPQKVRFLMSRGLSIDEVAKELGIGKGEVLLIADLDKT